MRNPFAFISAVIVAVGITLPAAAENVNMMTASPDGNYNMVICPAIAKYVARSGVNLKCVPSDGSGANYDAVYNDGVNTIGLGQLDAFGLKSSGFGITDEMAKANFVSDVEESMGSLGFIVGESLFCVAKKGGRVPEQASWTILNDPEPMDNPFVISTYGEASGPGLSLGYLRETFSNFGRNTEVIHKDNLKFEIELGRLRAGKRDMICWVTMANPEDKRLVAVTGSDDLFLVPFDSPELTTAKIGSVPAYTILDVPVTGSIANLFGGGLSVKTLTTGVTVYVNVDGLETKVYNALVSAVNDPELIPTSGFVGTLLKWQRTAMGSAMDAYRAVERVIN